MKLKETLLLLCLIGIIACEDVIDVDLQEADPILVVDAWLTNEPENQSILLTTTLPYFSEIAQPTVNGAIVTVNDEFGNEFIFNEIGGGEYVWSPSVAQPTIRAEGTNFELSVQIDGNSYTSLTTMGRVPTIDSLTIEVEKANAFFTGRASW